MRSGRRGTSTLAIEIASISERGIWLLVDEEEHFLPFEQFPWFRSATVEQIYNVERLSADHLRWPALDVDLSIDSIRDPGRYPLVSRAAQRGASADATKRRG
jgi:hypothetical protein